MSSKAVTKTQLRAGLKRKQALTIEHLVPATDEQAEALAQAKALVSMAQLRIGAEDADEQLAKYQKQLDDVKDDIRRTGTCFVFRGIGRVRFEELMREHPPTEAQRKDTQATFNPETFYAALLAETVEGGLTAEEWQTDFLDSKDWGVGEIQQIRKYAVDVNTGTRVAELGN